MLRKLVIELLDRGLRPSEVSGKLRQRGFEVAPSDIVSLGILRQAQPTILVQVDPKNVGVSDGIWSLPPGAWPDMLEAAWYAMPPKAQIIASNLIDRIIVSRPDDPRLLLSTRATRPRAALYKDALILSYEADPEEIWHEVGHAIVDGGLSVEEQLALEQFYDFSGEQRAPSEVLAEDFYFTVKGEEVSPFWQWWASEGKPRRSVGKMVSKKEPGTVKRVADVEPLQIVAAALEAFADLIYDSGEEQYVWLYGIATDALKEARKEGRLSYEERGAPHQYYFHEDVEQEAITPRKGPMSQPLQVPRPDVTMRGVTPTAPSPGIV